MSAEFPLILENVEVRRRGKRVIGPVNLTLPTSGPIVIIGPNGSGKTTLLKVMHGIEHTDMGVLTWQRDDPSKHAFVFQSPIVMRRTVRQNLAYPLQLLGRPRAEVKDAVEHWLDRVNLRSVGDNSALRLSGGERQKLAIARALIRQPDVLFLDEPTANLDGHTTNDIEVILQETAEKGTEIVMTTHDMGQARRLATHMVFLLRGQAHEAGPADELFLKPSTPELAAFLRGDIVT